MVQAGNKNINIVLFFPNFGTHITGRIQGSLYRRVYSIILPLKASQAVTSDMRCGSRDNIL